MNANFIEKESTELANIIKEYQELFKCGYLPSIDTMVLPETVAAISSTTKDLKEQCEYAKERRADDVNKLLNIVKTLGL